VTGSIGCPSLCAAPAIAATAISGGTSNHSPLQRWLSQNESVNTRPQQDRLLCELSPASGPSPHVGEHRGCHWARYLRRRIVGHATGVVKVSTVRGHHVGGVCRDPALFHERIDELNSVRGLRASRARRSAAADVPAPICPAMLITNHNHRK